MGLTRGAGVLAPCCASAYLSAPPCRIDKHRVADATVWGGLARYINHCCAPNCYTKVFTGPEGVARMGIYAKRDVDLGEELHYDYMVRGQKGV